MYSDKFQKTRGYTKHYRTTGYDCSVKSGLKSSTSRLGLLGAASEGLFSLKTHTFVHNMLLE